MFNKIFFGMLIFVPATLVGEVLGVSPLVSFLLSALAIIPVAKYIGDATGELAIYTGPTMGGLLNATFGNATELIISIFALQAGLIEVVKASITGSIISNLLLVLGAAIMAGGIKYESQTFNVTVARASASTLLLAVIALVIPAIFRITSPTAGAAIIEELSIFVAVFMLIVYAASLVFVLYTHKHLQPAEGTEAVYGWSRRQSLIILILATIGVAVMSEILVRSIEPLVKSLGWTELFIGVIFVAIIGNAAEHTSAIMMAMKDRMDVAIQISIGSATQIAMFVAPLLVLLSLLFAEPMSLVFSTFELVAIIMAVLIANLITEDGESNWLEGVQLLMAYAIMGVAFFFHP